MPAKYNHIPILAASAVFVLLTGPESFAAAATVAALSFVFSLIIEKKGGKALFCTAVVVTVLPLFVLKYGNFLSGGKLGLFAAIGISFYTFRAVSYLSDVYKKKQRAETDAGKYALYIFFFPEFMSGPIERYGAFEKCLNKEIRFDYARVSYALRLIVFGVFKKAVAADGIALYVDAVYEDMSSFGGVYVIAAAVLYSFQIYFDFSGYSDIACGIAYLFGFEPPENFSRPYLGVNIKDFWRRWHISLTSFFRSYIYIPLGGSRRGTARHILNVFIIFIISGIWHGAGLNFLVWGALHGIYMIVYILFSKYRADHASGIQVPGLVSGTISRLLTFVPVCFAWIFFRAENLSAASEFISRMFAPVCSTFEINVVWIIRIAFSSLLILVYALYGKERFAKLPPAVRTAVCAVMISMIYLFISGSAGEFVYFAF